jgi:hypothetical protein
LAGQVAYVFGGLALCRAPASVYRALLQAPILVAWKLRLRLAVTRRGRATEWVRGPRAG